MLMDTYVDDFYWIMPPVTQVAQKISENFGKCLEEVGIEEEKDKREGPSAILKVIGLEWNTINMTVQPSKENVQKILNTL